MKKVIASVGLVALSAASLQAQSAGMNSSDNNGRDWSLAAALRGFYDDNYLTLPGRYLSLTGGYARPLGSWGTEFIPSGTITHAGENTTVSASYVLDLLWYENKSTTDVSHQFNAGLDHAFGERYKLSLTESFVVAQEPTVLDPQIISSPLRTQGNNIRNTGTVNFTDSLTKELDLHLSYGNTVYAYQQLADDEYGWHWETGAVAPQASRSALLDRMEHLADIDLRWHESPTMTYLGGYQFGHTDYTSPEYIIYPTDSSYYGPTPPVGVAPGVRSNERNSDSHYAFLGVDDSLTETLSLAVRGGAEYIDYYNANDSRVSPYADVSLTDQYATACSFTFGVKHTHNATDVPGSGSSPVLDEESTAIYFSDSHKLTDKLSASVMGQAQLSTFVGGGSAFDDNLDQFFILQVNAQYHWNPWLLTEAGYNYSRLKSDLPDREYARDVMYVGFRATY